jgi:hypothetical protein
MTEKKLTLTESFRTVLRASYPSRPALADEIQSPRYFHSARRCHCLLRRIEPEAQAADEAMATLKDGIMSGSVRLRGRLNDTLPDDIEAMEIAWSGVHVFDNTLDVYDRGRTLRTYRHVHCYAAEIAALIGVAEQPPRANGTKRGPRAVAQEAIKACFPEQGGDVDLPDGPFLKQVFGWLENKRPAFASMSNRTVLRAAGRVK